MAGFYQFPLALEYSFLDLASVVFQLDAWVGADPMQQDNQNNRCDLGYQGIC